jgi:isoleucyl-tRNA synthetase
VLTKEDVEITSDDIPGWIVASENGISVALDINITDELRQEGIARDLVNRIQNLRKDMGLEIQDKIKLMIVEEDAQVKLAVDTFAEYITSETQASELTWHSKLEDSTLLEIDDVKVELKIYK